MGYGQIRNTQNWCSICYRNRHDECSGHRNIKRGGKDPANRIPCGCTICTPGIRI